MKASNYILPTTKEDPADAVVASHKLMIRAGLVRKSSSGLYHFLPMGLRVLKKIERIVREEMDKSGALEFELPILTPAEIWQEYPRYLKALLLRLDRLPNNLQRDLAAINDVDPWMDKVFKFKNDSKIKEMYLMLEEFRISLFSQPMKTKLPISPTRLQKLWDRLAIG